MTATTLSQLVDLLDLEQIELNIFRGQAPNEGHQRVFGGQVAGQALVAAGRTVPDDRPVHSLHAYFLRPGDLAVPIVYEVDRIRDGRSFTTRRVVAIQNGQPIFNLAASFHAPESGLDHQLDMPDVPDPESLPTMAERLESFGDDEVSEAARLPRPVDMRWVGEDNVTKPRGHAVDRTMVWIRADGKLPDNPLLHVCVTTYTSDMTLLDSVVQRHGLNWIKDGVVGASLDHAMWFHRPFRVDEWLLFVQESPAAAGGRGLARSEIFTADGQLVVSVVQEGLLRFTAQ